MTRSTVGAILSLLLAASISLGCVRINQNRIQGSGVAKTEDRAVEQFDKVTVEGAADVRITVGPQTQLSVQTDDNILPLIETKVKGDTLVISSTQSYSTRLGVKVTISVPQLAGISIRGSGDVDVSGINGETFSASISGAGDVTASGTVGKVDASIRGSGDLKLGELQAKSASISIAGSGDVTVNAAEELSVSIAGSGDVKYKGSPSKVSKSIAGSGSVRPVG